LGLEVCGEAVDGVDTIEKARALNPDLVVIDLAMPRMDGVEATSELRAMMPRAPIVLSQCMMTPWAAPWLYPQGRTSWFPSLTADGSYLNALEACFRLPERSAGEIESQRATTIFIQGTIEVDTVNTLFSGVRCVRSRKFWELDLDDFVTDGVPDQIGDRVTIETPHEGSTMRLCRLNTHPESNSNVPIRLAFGQ
jgi:hypothetical protein